VEVPRAARRASPDEAVHARAEEVLSALDLVVLGADVRALAARLEPAVLRSLDAIHLASALTLAEQLECFVGYDERLCEAAERAGLAVASPA
jgi:hypothetical protein